MDGWTGRADKLRAADRALERLVQIAEAQPIRLGRATGAEGEPPELEVTQQELLYQQARTVQRIGELLANAGSQREHEAASFYLHRAVRKLRLAGLTERDETLREVMEQIAAVEQIPMRAQKEQLVPQSPPIRATPPEDESCVIC